jgi:hypothetical protein
VIGGEGRYLCPPTLLDDKGKVKPVRLTDGDPVVAFQSELREVVRCVSQNSPSDILSGDLARDAIVICHKQSESLAAGRPVRLSNKK